MTAPRLDPPPAPGKSTGRQGAAVFGLALLALLGFGAFFVGFLLAPLAILLVFCLAFAAREQRKDAAADQETLPPPRRRLVTEAEVRRAALGREAHGTAAATAATTADPAGPGGADGA